MMKVIGAHGESENNRGNEVKKLPTEPTVGPTPGSTCPTML